MKGYAMKEVYIGIDAHKDTNKLASAFDGRENAQLIGTVSADIPRSIRMWWIKISMRFQARLIRFKGSVFTTRSYLAGENSRGFGWVLLHQIISAVPSAVLSSEWNERVVEDIF